MPLKLKVGTKIGVEKEFFEALSRLQEGKPQNSKLRLKAKQGALKINFSSVALEAGRSRVLIGMEKCAYPAARLAIQSAMVPVVETSTAEGVIKNLRAENFSLRRSIKMRDSENAALLMKMRTIEREASRRVAEAKRQLRTHENEKMASKGFTTENRQKVVKFPNRKDDFRDTEI